MKRAIIITYLMITLLSCAKEIKFDIDAPYQMAVNSLFSTNDSRIEVQLTGTQSIFDEPQPFDPLVNAEVVLFINGNKIVVRYDTDSKVYVADYQVNAGDVVELKAEAPGYDSVYSLSTQIASAEAKFELDTYEVSVEKEQREYDLTNGEHVVINDYSIQETGSCTITISNPSKENYYCIGYSLLHYYPDGAISKGRIDILTDNPIILHPYKNLSTDNIVNGGDVVSLTVGYGINNSFRTSNLQTGVQLPDKREIVIEVYSFSKDYYLFQSSIEKYNKSSSFLSEPVQIYTNIEGGVGIFTNYAIFRVTKTLPSPF